MSETIGASKKRPITFIGLKNANIGFEENKILAHDITLALPKGKVAWLTGPSGSGKSALLKIFAGLLSPLSGHVIINNDVISEMSFEEFLPYRLNIGYSFEIGGLLNNRTLYDNVMLPLVYHSVAPFEDCHNRTMELFKLFGIERYKNERPSSVSGAVRKATCVARAFVLEPDVLLLDEPTTGLTDEGLEAMLHLIRTSTRTPITLMTSRDQNLMESIADVQLRLAHEASYLLFRDMKKDKGKKAV